MIEGQHGVKTVENIFLLSLMLGAITSGVMSMADVKDLNSKLPKIKPTIVLKAEGSLSCCLDGSLGCVTSSLLLVDSSGSFHCTPVKALGGDTK